MIHTQICFAEFVKKHLNFEFSLIGKQYENRNSKFKVACDSTEKLHFWKFNLKKQLKLCSKYIPLKIFVGELFVSMKSQK